MQNATWSPGLHAGGSQEVGQAVGGGVELGEGLHLAGAGHDDGRLVGVVAT